jgi:hypothetical protein
VLGVSGDPGGDVDEGPGVGVSVALGVAGDMGRGFCCCEQPMAIKLTATAAIGNFFEVIRFLRT